MRALLPFVVIGLVNGSVYGLAGMGLVLTYRTSGIFNFAHGAVAAGSAYAFYELRDRAGLPWPAAVLLCVLVIAPIVGVALERLAARLAAGTVATKIVGTLGLLIAIQQLIVIRYGAQTLPLSSFLPTNTVRIGSVNVEVGQLMVMALALAAALALHAFLAASGPGRAMRGVVDDPDLLALTGRSPRTVRRWSWCIGSAFAGLSGVLLAPTIGLDPVVLTLLVVQAFGAAAIGLFTNIRATYVGGLVIGVAAAIATKYVADISWMAGLPSSVPFIALFVTLVAVPARRFRHLSIDRPRNPVESRPLPAGVKAAGLVALAAALVLVPSLVGTRLILFTSALVYVIVFLSLALLERTSGQLSLAHLGFAAVGAAAFSHLADGLGLPWLLAVLLSAAIAVPVGALVAIPAIRLSGLYLALATFGFGLLLERLFFPTELMFGGEGNLIAPRPTIASSDRAYYFVVLAFVVAAVGLLVAVHRSRLGRLLRAMADAPIALTTYGTNVTAIKLLVFCISSFLAGLAGALLGPITGLSAPAAYGTFPSLMLVVVLALQGPVGEVRAAFGAAIALAVIPSYVTDPSLNEWFPVLFGGAALVVAVAESGDGVRRRLAAVAVRAGARLERTPVRTRLAAAATSS